VIIEIFYSLSIGSKCLGMATEADVRHTVEAQRNSVTGKAASGGFTDGLINRGTASLLIQRRRKQLPYRSCFHSNQRESDMAPGEFLVDCSR